MKGKRIVTALLILSLALGLAVLPAGAVEATPAPQYNIAGSYNSRTGVYTLQIRLNNVFAWTGRIGISFDTAKVSLTGTGLTAFTMAAGVQSAQEGLKESELVSGEKGYACLAWYATQGVDARGEEKSIASLNFRLKVPSSELDAATFRLRCLEPDELGSWKSAASINARGDVLPVPYAYLTESGEMDVRYSFPGSDRAITNGKTLRISCRDIFEEIVAGAEVTVNTQTCTADESGVAEVILGPGDYMYRVRRSGYGDVYGRVTVAEDPTPVSVTMVSDADLVRQTQEELTITFQEGDSEEHVTGTLALLQSLNGTDIRWESSAPNIITRDGLVYLPSDQGEEVTLTARITRGEASAEKTFTVYVCSQAELNPYVPTASGKFQDLDGYAWAREAIEEMASKGIIFGTSDTSFSPGNNIRRGDFVALLMRMLNTGAAANTAFSDVPENSYYFKEIAQARTLGIAAGTGNNQFNPDDPITRQDMITFVIRAMDKTGYIRVGDQRDDLRGFRDMESVAGYAFDSVSAAVANGLIIGSDGMLTPLVNTTRAEAAVFLYRIFKAHSA